MEMHWLLPQTTASLYLGRVGPWADAPPHGDRYRTLSALSPGPFSGDHHALSLVVSWRRAPYDRTTIMRRRAAAPLACMPDGCPTGRDPVRASRAASLPWRSGLTGVQPCTDADTGPPGPS